MNALAERRTASADRGFDAVVIGAGFAGFSAATALVERGARVLVVEARPGLGGRATAFTDPETAERVDNGQHILMGCYYETFAFLRRIGAANRLRWQTGLKVPMIDRAGRHSTLSLPALPPPLNFLAGVIAWDALSWGERLSVLKIGAAIGPAGGGPRRDGGNEPLGSLTVRAWLHKHGQAPRLCELFWEPLALAALNQSIDQAEAIHFIRILQRVFGADPAASALVLPAVPLDQLYAEPAKTWLEQRGSAVRVNAPAKIVVENGRVRGVRVRDEAIEAPLVIAAVPWHAFGALFDAPPPQLHDTIANASRLASLPIVTVNRWFDRAVMQESLLGLPGRHFQWVFDRRALIGGAASHLSLVSSGAESIVAMSNDQLAALALCEVREALPPARSATVLKSLAVREKRSTFSLAADAPPRPAARTAIEGLILAGDWIDTGLPATIESAVASGHAAAEYATETQRHGATIVRT
jgi:squalene-associated FAD-dependent desaturase